MLISLLVTDVDELLQAAFSHGLYAVGGRVRDAALEAMSGVAAQTKDHDYLLVGYTFDRAHEHLQSVGQVSIAGRSFAVFKLTTDDGTVDVALARPDEINPSAPKEGFSPAVTLNEDLSRRDFTMNMMAWDLHLRTLHDPFGGIEALQRGVIDVYRPMALVDDPVRLLRAVQFSARFGFALSPALEQALVLQSKRLSDVPAARLFPEIAKLLTRAKEPSRGFNQVGMFSLLQQIIPELLETRGVLQGEHHAHDVWGHLMRSVDAAKPTLVARTAALLHDVGKPRVKAGRTFPGHEATGSEMARAILTRLHFPNGVTERVSTLIAYHGYDANPTMPEAGLRRFIQRVGPQLIEDLFDLREAALRARGRDVGDELARTHAFAKRVREELTGGNALTLQDLAIDGNDVVALLRAQTAAHRQFKGHPAVGEVLHRLLDRVIEEPALNTIAHLQLEARRIIREQAAAGRLEEA